MEEFSYNIISRGKKYLAERFDVRFDNAVSKKLKCITGVDRRSFLCSVVRVAFTIIHTQNISIAL